MRGSVISLVMVLMAASKLRTVAMVMRRAAAVSIPKSSCTRLFSTIPPSSSPPQPKQQKEKQKQKQNQQQKGKKQDEKDKITPMMDDYSAW